MLDKPKTEQTLSAHNLIAIKILVEGHFYAMYPNFNVTIREISQLNNFSNKQPWDRTRIVNS